MKELKKKKQCFFLYTFLFFYFNERTNNVNTGYMSSEKNSRNIKEAKEKRKGVKFFNATSKQFYIWLIKSERQKGFLPEKDIEMVYSTRYQQFSLLHTIQPM